MARATKSRSDLYVALALAAVAFAVTLAITWPPGAQPNPPTAAIATHRPLPAPVVAPLPAAPKPAPAPTQPTLAGVQWIQPKAPAPSVEPATPAGPQLPALPVRVSFPFNSRVGARTLQIVATNATDESLAVEVEVSNETTGKRDQHTVSLNPPRLVTLGPADGTEVQQGDAIRMHAAGYAELVRRVL